MTKVLVSLLRCINIVSTRYALKAAIIIAVATVNLPIFIPAIATVLAVSAIKESQTKI
jgi:hypothetical protein